ncbi:F-box only protein 5-like [Dermacentor andersoni]|uniref:F-box only protein 5-like n=1 Tax=Dermacentor andersoni TaxID=34620 RepID=UPI002416C2C8|nr:F-box only protein 43-like [Dermacentor andersoni]XP_054930373.1 F-box only protein 43-like [Dermacentor andersoni]
MAHTPARSASFLAVHETPRVLQSTPISTAWSPESGYFGSDGQSSYRSCTFSTSSALVSEDDSEGICSIMPYSNPMTQLLCLPKESPPPRVDILKKLKGFRPVMCKILGYLSSQELASACRVSSEWRKQCLSIPEQALRFTEYIKKREEQWESSRENLHNRKPSRREPSNAPPLTVHNAQAEVQNSTGQAEKAMDTRSRLDLHIKEAKNLQEGEWLWPCPVCRYPSRVTAAGTVALCKCGYKFCPKCRRDSHLPKPCVAHSGQVISSRTQKNIIGSKYSKRQLRRL